MAKTENRNRTEIQKPKLNGTIVNKLYILAGFIRLHILYICMLYEKCYMSLYKKEEGFKQA